MRQIAVLQVFLSQGDKMLGGTNVVEGPSRRQLEFLPSGSEGGSGRPPNLAHKELERELLFDLTANDVRVIRRNQVFQASTVRLVFRRSCHWT